MDAKCLSIVTIDSQNVRHGTICLDCSERICLNYCNHALICHQTFDVSRYFLMLRDILPVTIHPRVIRLLI